MWRRPFFSPQQKISSGYPHDTCVERRTTSTVKVKLNPTKTVINMTLKSILEQDRARIGGTSQKK
jgi:hypothetical protein